MKINLKCRCSVNEQMCLENSLIKPTRACVDSQLDIPSLGWGVSTELFLVPQVEALCFKTDSLFFQNFNKTTPGIGCSVLE